MARPGEVSSDEQAFQQIRDRLENEVGSILKLVELGRPHGYFRHTAPFWSLVRMIFPIAESMGGLIYGDDSTVVNLCSILEREFEAVRAGYADKATVITLLYRHALTHQDEMPTLQTGGKQLGWHLSYASQSGHLQVALRGSHLWLLQFDTTAFYEDTANVCRNLAGQSWKGQVVERYNAWLTKDLDAGKSNRCTAEAIRYIQSLNEIPNNSQDVIP